MAKITYPTKYTTSNLIAYISEKHDISKKVAKTIWDDVFEVLSVGILSGQRIPFGNLGKAYVKVRPATKSRKGRNPATGEEITIKAKPATKVPKFTYGKAFKEASKKAKI